MSTSINIEGQLGRSIGARIKPRKRVIEGHIFGSGEYVLSKAGSRVTQILTIVSATPNSLAYGSIPTFRINSITVTQDSSIPTNFNVSINGTTVTARGGVAFSGSGSGSTLAFTSGENEYTITYST